MIDLLIYGRTREWYNDFITKVFNYYNGRINKKYSAVLQINWININDDSLGYFMSPGIVVINAGTISRRAGSEFVMLLNIILTVIHELYHADQYINDGYYDGVSEYEESVEAPIYGLAANYVLSHIDEVIWLSDGIIDKFKIDYYDLLSKIKDGCMYPYNEIDIVRYVYNVLVGTLQLDVESINIFAKIYYEIINIEGGLILNIDNFRCTIIHDGKIVTDYNMINMYLRHVLMYGESYDFEMEMKNIGDNYMLIVKSKIKRTMCDVVNKAVSKEE